MNLELTDEQTEALIRELSRIIGSSIIEYDRYRLSPRIVALKEILGMLRPEPVREPLPPRRHYEPPSKGIPAATLSRLVVFSDDIVGISQTGAVLCELQIQR